MFSHISFAWVDPVFESARASSSLKVDQLPALSDDLASTRCSERLWKCLIRERPDKGPKTDRAQGFSLLRCFFRAFGHRFLATGILKFVNMVIAFQSPLRMQALVSWLDSGDKEDGGAGYCVVGCCIAFATLNAVGTPHFDWWQGRFDLQIRSALLCCIHRKSLLAPCGSLKANAHTMLSSDVDQAINMFFSLHELWCLPLQIAACMYMLYTQVRFAFLAGLVVIVILMPINRLIAKRIQHASEETIHAKDKRVHLMEQIMRGIRQVKMMGWERIFESKVTSVREKELEGVATHKYLDALCVYFWAGTSVVFSLCTFSLHALWGRALKADMVFMSITLFNMLILPLNSLPWVINGIVEGLVSMTRLEEFFEGHEVDTATIQAQQPHYKSNKTVQISLENASFAWDSCSPPTSPPPLHNITHTIQEGTFTVVVGGVASGKSSLLAAISSEMHQVEGGLEVNGRLGYVSQDPWVMAGSLQENVLLGAELDECRYRDVLSACALDVDMEALKGGDLYEVGGQGARLSGGQRVRLALARVLYQDCDVYLIDDVLSSVDAHVANWLITHALAGRLMEGKTCVLATKSAACIQMAHSVIHMKNGTIEKVEDKHPAVDPPVIDCAPPTVNNSVHTEHEDSTEDDGEDRMTGRVHPQVFFTYFKAMGGGMIALLVVSLALMQVTRNGADLSLSQWVAHEEDSASSGPSRPYLRTFILISVSNSIFTLARAFLFAHAGLKAARHTHQSLLSASLQAPMKFFEKTPLGGVLSRFSTDIHRIDNDVPFILNLFLARLLGVIGACCMLLSSQPIVMLTMVPLLIPWGSGEHFPNLIAWDSKFRTTSRELRRLKAAAFAPIHTSVAETLEGAATIRALNVQQYFLSKHEGLVDAYLRAVLASKGVDLWMALRLKMTSALLVAVVGIVAVTEGPQESGASVAGLGLTYVMPFVSLLAGVLTTSAETEQEMVAMERILQFINEKSEDDSRHGNAGQRPLPFHPPSSPLPISFEKVCVQYAPDLPHALKNFTLEVGPGMHVAICGRTGAGKSSLVNALLGLVDLQSGEIFVGERNMLDMDVKALRRCFGVVSQIPFLFGGTLRENLDPAAQFTDPQILEALEAVQMVEGLQELATSNGASADRDSVLSCDLGESGDDLSHGQKKLLCMARVLLQKPHCLILDEFTAGVAPETARIMRDVVKERFKNATVIEIAHDLSGVLDFDKIVVMGDGMLLEEGRPRDLLRRSDSGFARLHRADSTSCRK